MPCDKLEITNLLKVKAPLVKCLEETKNLCYEANKRDMANTRRCNVKSSKILSKETFPYLYLTSTLR